MTNGNTGSKTFNTYNKFLRDYVLDNVGVDDLSSELLEKMINK